MRALGIDIGGTSIKLAGMHAGRVEWTAQSKNYSRADTTTLIDALRSAGAQRVRGVHFDAIGLCVPGLLDEVQQVVTLSVNVPGLTGVPLKQLVGKSLDIECQNLRIFNDALAAGFDVIAEKQLAGRVISITLGTGVGMAVLDDGKPLIVEGTSPGHIGQVDVSLAGDIPIGPDGGAGSLEGYIGVPALVKRYGDTHQFLLKADATAPPLQALTRAIRICHAIYRPHHVILVGGIGIRLQRLISDIKRQVDDQLTSVARAGWTLSTGENDFHAAIGAARLAMQKN